jgi:hypothetical protein
MADQNILPKSGFKTSSFTVVIATIIVGGAFTYLVQHGLPKDLADSHRQVAIDLVSQLLPVAYLWLVGAVARAHIKARQVVTQAKADAMVAAARAQADGR